VCFKRKGEDMKKAIGIDISKYDRTFNPQESMYPLDFVVARAGHAYNGIFYEDPRFVSYFPGIAQVPVKMSYCYLNSATTLNIQVEEFIDTINKAPFEWDVLVCDWESAYNTVSESFADKGLQWMEQVKELTGKPVWLYTNRSLYETYWQSRGLGYPLWISNPLADGTWNTETIHNKVPRLPQGRETWQMWQFSFTIKGTDWGTSRPAEGDIDMYNGTLAEMKEYIRGEGNTPEIPMDKRLVDTAQLEQLRKDVEAYRLLFNDFKVAVERLEEIGEKLTADIDTLIRTSENPDLPIEPVEPIEPESENDKWKLLFGLNIRKAPYIADNKVGAIGAGEVVEVFDYATNNNGLWGKIGVNQWIALEYQSNILAEEI